MGMKEVAEEPESNMKRKDRELRESGTGEAPVTKKAAEKALGKGSAAETSGAGAGKFDHPRLPGESFQKYGIRLKALQDKAKGL